MAFFRWFKNKKKQQYLSSQTEKELQAENLNEYWIQKEYTKIFTAVQGVKTLDELSSILITELCRSVNAYVGTIYKQEIIHFSKIVDLSQELDFNKMNNLYLVSAFGTAKSSLKEMVTPEEGLVGQVARDLRPLFYEDIVEETFVIESHYGAVHPKSICAYPIIYKKKLLGVVSLYFLKSITADQKKLIEWVMSGLSVNTYSVIQSMLNKELYQEIFESNYNLQIQKKAIDASAIVVELDLKGRIIYINDKLLEISQYSQKELVGHTYKKLDSEYHPKEFFADLWDTVLKGKIWKGEIKNKAKDGSFYWVDTTIYPVKNNKNKLIKFISISFDITEKKTVQKQLEQSTIEANKEVEAKTSFLANMSHEIRTPLNSILGLSEVLLETDLSLEQKKYLKSISSSGRSLLQIVNDILDLSKLEADKLEFEFESFDLEALLDDVIGMMAVKAHAKGLKLAFELDENIPYILIGDPMRLRQVLVNLVGNALKFTEKGSVQILISRKEINEQDHAATLEIKVVDTGIGIAQDQIQYLFDSFTQADSSITRKYGGTGLGLNIVQRLVDKMEGFIDVSSHLGEGSEFKLTIPFSYDPSFMDGNVNEKTLFKDKRILIADCDRESLYATGRYFESWGAKVIYESNLYEVMSKIQDNDLAPEKFDLIILSSDKKDIDTEEEILELKNLAEDFSHILVLLKSNCTQSEVTHLRQMGIAHCMKLPLSRCEFKEVGKQLILKEKNDNIHFNCPSQELENVVPYPETKKDMKILVADDSVDNINLYKVYFKDTKYKIDYVENGQIALDRVKLKDYDLVIMDMQMPQMDGYEATRLIRQWEDGENKSHVHVVALSANALAEEKTKALQAGCSDYLTKPIYKSTLMDYINNFYRDVS